MLLGKPKRQSRLFDSGESTFANSPSHCASKQKVCNRNQPSNFEHNRNRPLPNPNAGLQLMSQRGTGRGSEVRAAAAPLATIQTSQSFSHFESLQCTKNNAQFKQNFEFVQNRDRPLPPLNASSPSMLQRASQRGRASQASPMPQRGELHRCSIAVGAAERFGNGQPRNDCLSPTLQAFIPRHRISIPPPLPSRNPTPRDTNVGGTISPAPPPPPPPPCPPPPSELAIGGGVRSKPFPANQFSFLEEIRTFDTRTLKNVKSETAVASPPSEANGSDGLAAALETVLTAVMSQQRQMLACDDESDPDNY